MHNGIDKQGWCIKFSNGKFITSSNHVLTLFKAGYGLVDILIEDYLQLPINEQIKYYLFDKTNKLYGFTITAVDNVKYYGFECDGDHRFYLGNGILTHNSWMGLKFGVEALKQGKKVGLYSGEMSQQKIGYRFDTLYQHFPHSSLVRGKAVEGYKEYIEEIQSLNKNFIVVTQKEFCGRPNAMQIRSFIEENKIDIMIIDQLSLMEDYRSAKNDLLRMKFAHITEDLFLLSTEFKIPILLLVQANRDSTKRTSNQLLCLEDIKESDDISHNSSKCIGIRKKDGAIYLDILKNREGRVGNYICYQWDINLGQFYYMPMDDDSVNTTVRQEIAKENLQKINDITVNYPF